MQNPQIAEYIEALKVDRWRTREEAAAALTRIGIPAIAPLCEALKDPDWEVRWHAAGALGAIGDDSATPALIRALQGDDWRTRERAAAALGLIGAVSALPALVDALKDTGKGVRACAANALGQIGESSAVAALIEAQKDPDWEVRWHVADALGNIGDAETLPRKIVSDARLPAQERIDVLEKLRQARYNSNYRTLRYTFPSTRTLCQKVLAGSDAEAHPGAQAVLNWLDAGRILVRASQSSASNSSDELLRAASGAADAIHPDTMLRGAEEPEELEECPKDMARRPSLRERLFGKRKGRVG